jgi:YD repeat-containing protein
MVLEHMSLSSSARTTASRHFTSLVHALAILALAAQPRPYPGPALTPSAPTVLAGNLLSIDDYKAGGTQTQSFTYDALDRLLSAQASGGTQGNYALESYTYDPTSGNLSSKAGVSYTYGPQSAGCPAGALSKAHAVVGAGANSYCYDLNGNMTRRSLAGTTYDLAYDAENRLAAVSGAASASFAYDGDGQRVKGVVNGTTTVYIGNYFEWTGSTSTAKKYYYADGARIALRSGNALSFLLGDHLGSTAISADSSGNKIAELRYKAWGETRYA